MDEWSKLFTECIQVNIFKNMKIFTKLTINWLPSLLPSKVLPAWQSFFDLVKCL